MSGYRLEAKDGSGTFSIPHGETVIGRGAFLGIADKRVSRSHAILEVVDDKLRIKPVHVNPCFYQASDKSTFVPLERNEWCWIQSGDCFSLLPDKYSFQVIAEHHSEEATLRNSEALVEDCTLNNSSPCSPIASGTKAESEEPSSSVRDLSKPDSSPPSKRCNTSKNDTFPDDPSSAVSCKDDVETPGTAQRKRVLPNWMLQGDLPVQSIPSPVIKAGKKKKKITETNMSAIKTVQSPVEKNQMSSMKLKDEVLPGTSSGSLLGATELGNSHKRCVIDNEEEMEVDNCDDTPDLSPIQTGGENSPSGSPSTKHHRPSNSKATNNDDLSLSPGSSQSTQQAPMRRPPCMYGAKCYRKNPAHFQEFSHPGDGDYRDVENGSQDDSDDRPECPYGTECYRKNPQHKLEYKHTKPPGRRLRKRATKKGAKSALEDDSDNDGEPNEYDLDDSFLDDDEDEDVTDEDSDWMPDSEEKNSEDMSQLLKEAKKFVKGKR